MYYVYGKNSYFLKPEWPESANKMCSGVIGFHIDNSRELKDIGKSSWLSEKH